MKVTAFCGSARRDGNTALLLQSLLAPLAEAGAETELIELAKNEIVTPLEKFVYFLTVKMQPIFSSLTTRTSP